MSFEEVTRNALVHALHKTGTSVKDGEIRDLLIAHDNMAAIPDRRAGVGPTDRGREYRACHLPQWYF
jgi:hypothetical protein